MPWSVTYRAEIAVVETVFAGLVRPEELRGAFEASMAKAREFGVMWFLADCSCLEGGHTILDLYGLVESLDAVPRSLGFREAILMPSLAGAAEDVRAYETFCVNRGLPVRIFGERDKALAWLTRP